MILLAARPPACASVRVSVLSCTGLFSLSADKESPVQERDGLQSVNNFQRGVTLNGKLLAHYPLAIGL